MRLSLNVHGNFGPMGFELKPLGFKHGYKRDCYIRHGPDLEIERDVELHYLYDTLSGRFLLVRMEPPPYDVLNQVHTEVKFEESGEPEAIFCEGRLPGSDDDFRVEAKPQFESQGDRVKLGLREVALFRSGDFDAPFCSLERIWYSPKIVLSGSGNMVVPQQSTVATEDGDPYVRELLELLIADAAMTIGCLDDARDDIREINKYLTEIS